MRLEAGGAHLLVDADPEADVGLYRSAYNESWLFILIPVRWSRASPVLKATAGVRARRQELLRAGFATCIRRCGLEVRATHAFLDQLKERPERLGILAPAIHEAVRIAALVAGVGPSPR